MGGAAMPEMPEDDMPHMLPVATEQQDDMQGDHDGDDHDEDAGDMPMDPGFGDDILVQFFGSRALRNPATGLCLDYDFRHPQRPAVTWSCHVGSSQGWNMRHGQLVNKRSEECLDYAIHKGNHAVIWGCHFGRNQQWSRHGDEIRSNYNGKCLQPSSHTLHTRKRGARVELHPCNGSPAQKWEWRWVR